jgi:hypothetical protein
MEGGIECVKGKKVKRLTACYNGWHNWCLPHAHQPASSENEIRGSAMMKPASKSCSESSEQDKYDLTVCEKCGRGDSEQEMLLCDGCDRGFHMFCLCPVLVTLPVGDWFCPLCSPTALVYGMLTLPYLYLFAFFRNLEARFQGSWFAILPEENIYDLASLCNQSPTTVIDLQDRSKLLIFYMFLGCRISKGAEEDCRLFPHS